MTLSHFIVSPFVSQKFRFYSFLSMLLLVFVHGYNLQDTYLQPWSLVREPLTVTTFTEYLFSNGLLRFRIPMLFIISGYLYALSDYKPYGERTRKRLRTLGIPYLLWSIFALLLTWGLEYSPVFLKAIQETRLAQISEHSILVSQYVWYEWIIRIFLSPIAFQLWFIRVLLIYNIAYPPLSWCVQKIPFVWFPLTLFLWFMTANLFFIEGEGLFFFTLGIWIQKKNFDIEHAPRYFSPTWGLVFFVFICIVKTYLAFQPATFLGGANEFVVNTLFKLAEILGMMSIWYGCDSWVRWAQKTWFLGKGQDFSFMIFALHVPILYYVMYGANVALASYPYHRLLTFIVIPFLVILSSMLIGFLLRRFSPAVYSTLTGGRGL